MFIPREHHAGDPSSIGGRPICDLHFVDDIGLMGDSENELQDFTTRLEEKAYGMEGSLEKRKILQISGVLITQRWHLDKGNQNKDCSGHMCYVNIWKSREISF